MRSATWIFSVIGLAYGCSADVGANASELGENIADCSHGWAEINDHYWAATHADYYGYYFSPDSEPILRVRGQFPEARLLSFSLESAETGAVVATLNDVDMQPFDDNPYVSEVAPGRDYEVVVAPDTTPVMGFNQLLYPAGQGGSGTLVLWVRVYVPTRDWDLEPRNLRDRGRLPQIIASHLDPRGRQTPLACPTVRPELPLGGALSEMISSLPPLHAPGDEIKFVNSLPSEDDDQEGGVQSDPNGAYIVARFRTRATRRGESPVAIIRFRAPAHQRALPVANDHDVRYWSICSAGGTLRMDDCVLDEEAYDLPPNEDELVHLVVGPERLRSRVPENMLFLAWGDYPVNSLLFRHKHYRREPDAFEPRFSQLPRYGHGQDLNDYDDQILGDYAPVGNVCWESEFIAGSCH